MSTGAGGESGTACRNCRLRLQDEEPDHHGWCAACRRVLVGRSTTWACAPTAMVGVLYLLVLGMTGGLFSRFLVAWLALGVLLAFGVFKVARRVLFDVIRNRGVPAAGTER